MNTFDMRTTLTTTRWTQNTPKGGFGIDNDSWIRSKRLFTVPQALGLAMERGAEAKDAKYETAAWYASPQVLGGVVQNRIGTSREGCHVQSVS